ncbi:unnamed protein product [Ilex paraguariensis]|uniref:NB-ARC domain-containing protein n=1 Tax=Ilex paraguariensis TaxID=185542 RepID=A0ABC8QZG0_9AQUA
MEQAKEASGVVIGEAAGAASLLLRKLKGYIETKSCSSKLRKELKALKGEIQHLLTNFAEVERNHARLFDDQTTLTDQSFQQEVLWMSTSKDVISNIEDEVDQIMTVHQSNNINATPKLFWMLPCTAVANCRTIKKHLTVIRELQNGGRKSRHHVSESQAEHSSAAPVAGVDNNNNGNDIQVDFPQENKGVEGQDKGKSYPANCSSTTREKIEEELVQFLTDKRNEDFPALMLVTGMAGVGKTFLVQKAFNKVKQTSSAAFWISYDSSLEKKDILANLYENVILMDCTYVLLPTYAREHMEVTGLQEHLKCKLSLLESSILIVDDVPDVKEAWDLFSQAFPNSGKVIFITHNIESAKAFKCDITPTCLEVDKLKHEDAWKLFRETVSKHPKYNHPWGCPESLKIAEAIVRDCHGVPLPIVTIATQLANQGMHSSVGSMLRANLVKKSFLPTATTETQTHPADHNISNNAILMLCYNALCFPLKYILLYCCFYLRGPEIPEKKLIRLCVAEGLVEDTENTIAEVAAADCLDQLVYCELIVRRDIPGKPRTYRIKDKLRELAPHIVPKPRKYTRPLWITDNVVSFTGNSSNTTIDSISQKDIAFVRSCFVSQSQQKSGKNPESENSEPTAEIQEKSEMIHQQKKKTERPKIFPLLIWGCQLLRVLDFTDAEFIEELPDQLGDIVHLRYLGLRSTKIKKLPQSLSRLTNLQCLDIRDTKVTSLPVSMMRHDKFRHLHLAKSFMRKVVDMQLTKKLEAPNLQTLAGVKSTNPLLETLPKWIRLRKLSIGRVKGFQSSNLCDAINNMKLLHSLAIKTHGVEELNMDTLIKNGSLETLKVGGCIVSLAHVVHCFGSLTRLYLWDNMSNDDPFQCLHNLNNLIVLCLSNAYREKEMKCCTGWFPNLKKLSIQRMRMLEVFEIEKGAMENLENFLVGYCPRLKPTREGGAVRDLDYLQHLKLVQISHMPLKYAEGLAEDPPNGYHSARFHIHVFPQNEFKDQFRGGERILESNTPGKQLEGIESIHELRLRSALNSFPYFF